MTRKQKYIDQMTQELIEFITYTVDVEKLVALYQKVFTNEHGQQLLTKFKQLTKK